MRGSTIFFQGGWQSWVIDTVALADDSLKDAHGGAWDRTAGRASTCLLGYCRDPTLRPCCRYSVGDVARQSAPAQCGCRGHGQKSACLRPLLLVLLKSAINEPRIAVFLRRHSAAAGTQSQTAGNDQNPASMALASSSGSMPLATGREWNLTSGPPGPGACCPLRWMLPPSLRGAPPGPPPCDGLRRPARSRAAGLGRVASGPDWARPAGQSPEARGFDPRGRIRD